MIKENTVFISYCQSDGAEYADEIQTQLEKNGLRVERDSTSLSVNDSIASFMAGIANCEQVVIVLSSGYLKSLNCMKEVYYLIEQKDWHSMTMVLVVDNSIYQIEKQVEIITYWKSVEERYCATVPKEVSEIDCVIQERMQYVSKINECIYDFLDEIVNKKNPSQIAIVGEILRHNKKDEGREELLLKSESQIMEIISNAANPMSVVQIADSLALNELYVKRILFNLISKNQIEIIKIGRNRLFQVSNR